MVGFFWLKATIVPDASGAVLVYSKCDLAWRKIATISRKTFWMGSSPTGHPCAMCRDGGHLGSSTQRRRSQGLAGEPLLLKGKVTQAGWAIALLGTVATFQTKTTQLPARKINYVPNF